MQTQPLTETDLPRVESQRLGILARLREGPVTNHVLAMHYGWRYGARLHELRKAGYVIQTERIAGAMFRYTLAE